ncbi:MAG: CooT family nickel-binding protein [Methanosarcinaceae archaeon]|jgi:predicted RNA-binding protein|nr:CooT family nickel-binding protein [Methanosarcinaceae archaeon]NKQ39424.1 CooT family nickel-binding protein [Methanosarcinales archaeon]
MCELKIIVDKRGTKETVMESVSKVVVNGNLIECVEIFGDKKTISGSIKEIDFSKGELLIIENV